MVSDRTCILHKYIPWGNIISLVPKSRSSVKVKVTYQGHSFRKNGRCGGHFCFTSTSCIKPLEHGSVMYIKDCEN